MDMKTMPAAPTSVGCMAVLRGYHVISDGRMWHPCDEEGWIPIGGIVPKGLNIHFKYSSGKVHYAGYSNDKEDMDTKDWTKLFDRTHWKPALLPPGMGNTSKPTPPVGPIPVKPEDSRAWTQKEAEWKARQGRKANADVDAEAYKRMAEEAKRRPPFGIDVVAGPGRQVGGGWRL